MRNRCRRRESQHGPGLFSGFSPPSKNIRPISEDPNTFGETDWEALGEMREKERQEELAKSQERRRIDIETIALSIERVPDNICQELLGIFDTFRSRVARRSVTHLAQCEAIRNVLLETLPDHTCSEKTKDTVELVLTRIHHKRQREILKLAIEKRLGSTQPH